MRALLDFGDKSNLGSTAPLVADQAGSSATRHGFIDLLRGFALILMVETHVVNAYLPEAHRSTPFFFWLSFVNGLVAPAFLLAVGFSLIL